MLRKIIFVLIFLTPVSFAQDVMSTDQQAVTVTSTSVPATATPVVTTPAVPITTTNVPVITTPTAPMTTDVAVTPAFPGVATPTVPVTTTDIINSNLQTSFCPPLSFYYIPAGYRVAGMSPSCQVVIVPMEEAN